jgi:hypothetical protein
VQSLWYPNFVHDTTITAMLAIRSDAFRIYLPSNYKIGATFVTIYVVLFMPFNPNTDVVQYRILDSLLELYYIFVANYFIWPS